MSKTNAPNPINPMSPRRPLAFLLGVGGGAVFALGCALGQMRPLLATLAVGWLFFAGISAGAVALSAVIRVARGGWAATILPTGDTAAGFLAPAFVPLVPLVVLARSWMPGLADASTTTVAWLVGRNLIATAALVVAGNVYARRSNATGSGPPSFATLRAAVVYLLVYVGTLSLWAVDLVMSLHDGAPSTVVPPLYFMGAFLGGTAWCALIAAGRGHDAPVTTEHQEARHDIGKLLFALCAFWAYLAWAQFLPVWYANLPDETGPLLARWTPAYRPLTIGVILCVFALPFVLLFPEWTKKRPATLAVTALIALTGLFAERVLLVIPSLPVPPHGWALLTGALMLLGMLGSFIATAVPPRYPTDPTRPDLG